MGLDMYLEAKAHLSTFDKKKHFNSLTGRGGIIELKKPITSFSVDLGYWRKANAVHNWFVKNVQEGIDDCRSYSVPLEKLEELLEVCEKVLAEKDSAVSDKLLPSAEGFFFGGTEYDEYYYEQVGNTIEIIKEAFDVVDELSNNKSLYYVDVTYTSSW